MAQTLSTGATRSGTTSAESSRAPLVDVWRGAALLAMIIYHSFWFADSYGLLNLDMSQPGWRVFQRAIAGSFFFLVGVSLALATRHRLNVPRTLSRLGRVGVCALVVTLSSWALDPQRVVWFGILHAIFVMGICALPFHRLGGWNLVLGSLCLGLPGWILAPDAVWWLGLSAAHPASFDFQPFFPWFGVVLWGLAMAPWVTTWPFPQVGWLARAGRHSLLVYMGHVPVIVGVCALLSQD